MSKGQIEIKNMGDEMSIAFLKENLASILTGIMTKMDCEWTNYEPLFQMIVKFPQNST